MTVYFDSSLPALCFLQLEDTFKEGEEKTEQHEKEDIKSEDNAVEMSEDFDGQMCDADEKEPGQLSWIAEESQAGSIQDNW